MPDVSYSRGPPINIALGSSPGKRGESRRLLSGAALYVLQPRLAHFDLFALWLADDKSAAAEVFGLIEILVRQWVLLRSEKKRK
jgi:hypothetical protein